MLVVERRIQVGGARGGGMNHTEKRVRVGTSETAVRGLINAPWRQVLSNMEI